jgi:hypothetical protein
MRQDGGTLPLEHLEVLTLTAEIAAAFLGFSYVIGLLQDEQPNAAETQNAMRGVAELALIAGGGSFLALSLNTFALSSDLVWRISSGLTGLSWLIAHYLASRRFRAAGKPMMRSRLTLGPVPLAVVGVLLLAWNALLPSGYSGARYVAALILALAASALFFVGTTFGSSDERPAA